MDFLRDQVVEQATALKGLWRNKRQVRFESERALQRHAQASAARAL